MSDEIETIDKNPKSWAAWKRKAERLQAIIDDMALAAMDSEPAIADCDPEVYEKGVSVCLVAIPKETAEIICQNITAATGCKVDWHYFGGRVHIKALRVASQPAPVVPEEKTIPNTLSMYAVDAVAAIAEVKGWNACRAAMLNAGNSPGQSDFCPAQNHVSPEQNGDTPAQRHGWIPVSERMPENDGAYLCWDNRYVTTYAFIFGAWQANQFIAKNITHWMPLPAGPQEVKGE